MTFSNGNTTLELELDQENYEFSPNTFLTGTYPQAKYMYAFDQSSTDYVALLIACIAASGSDVVGDFHEYRLPTGATYELRNISLVANSSSSTFTPAAGYVLGTGHFSDTDATFRFVIRPSSLMNTNYHQIVFNHTNVGTAANSKALEISANLSYFGTTTYSKPQDSLAENRKLVPVYWRMGSDPGDRLVSSYDGSRYMTSSGIYCPLSVTIDWDEDHNTFTDDWWTGYYILPIATATPMTVAKSTFMCTAIDEDTTLPGLGRIGSGFSRTVTYNSVTMSNGVLTITMDRSTGNVVCSSTAKSKLPEGYTYTYEKDPNFMSILLVYGHPYGMIELDMITGNWFWDD